MRRLLVPILVLMLMVPFIPSAVAREPTTISTITIDGDIRGNDPTYTRDATGNDIYVYYSTYYRGFIEWNTVTIPDVAIIESVSLRIRTYSSNAEATEFWSMESRPSIQTNNNAGNKVIYDDARDGTKYYTSGVGSTNTWYTYNLGATGASDLQSKLASDWFAVGMHSQPNIAQFYSSETAYDAQIIVQWHLAADYHYQVTGTYYENGTVASPEDVTVSDSFSETFSADGVTDQYYPVAPALFTWDLGSGYSRQVFVWQEENFTIFLPESTDYVYGFIIKDYTGKLGLGGAYLEAWRTIGGVEKLVSRMPIQQPNTIPINLVYGRTYNIKILYADGSRLTWGYFVAGGSFSPTILLRDIEFDQTAYLVNTFLTVEAQRSNETLITVDYLDERSETIWANVTVRIRNGAIVATYNSNSSGYTWNYAGAVSGTNYIVTVQGLHVKAGNWGYSNILDAVATFPTLPTLTGVFTLGGIDIGEIIGYVIALMGYLGFSYRWKGPGMMGGLGILALVRFIGLITMNYYLLAAIGFLSIAVALLAGGET